MSNNFSVTHRTRDLDHTEVQVLDRALYMTGTPTPCVVYRFKDGEHRVRAWSDFERLFEVSEKQTT